MLRFTSILAFPQIDISAEKITCKKTKPQERMFPSLTFTHIPNWHYLILAFCSNSLLSPGTFLLNAAISFACFLLFDSQSISQTIFLLQQEINNTPVYSFLFLIQIDKSACHLTSSVPSDLSCCFPSLRLLL